MTPFIAYVEILSMPSNIGELLYRFVKNISSATSFNAIKAINQLELMS